MMTVVALNMEVTSRNKRRRVPVVKGQNCIDDNAAEKACEGIDVLYNGVG
jgi:hypothetical protein